MKSRALTLAIPTLTSLMLLSGCGGAGGNDTLLPDPATLFVNLSPDVRLDYFTNDDRRATNLGFAEASTAFVSFEPDELDVRTLANGSTIELTNDLFSFQRDTNSLIVSFGLNNFGTETEKRLRTSYVAVDRNAPNGTKSRVIFAHGYIRATGEGNHPIVVKNALTNPSVTFPAIAFGNTTTQDIDSGPQTFIAQRDGTDGEIVRATRTLEPGKIYLMHISGVEGATGATAPALRFLEIPAK